MGVDNADYSAIAAAIILNDAFLIFECILRIPANYGNRKMLKNRTKQSHDNKSLRFISRFPA